MLLRILGIKVPDYPTLNRRMRNLTIPIDFDESSNVYKLAVDSTGYKVSNRRD